MTTLYDLIHGVSWDSIETVLQGHYQINDEGIENHRKVRERMMAMDPVSNPITIIFETYENDEDVEIKISGEDGTVLRDMPDFKYMNIPENDVRALTPVRFGIEFKPWQKWLGMAVSPQTLQEFSPEEVVAHCLWEMTFISFDETEIQNTIEDLEKKVEDIKAGRHKAGKQFKSVKEMLDYLERTQDDDEESEEGFQKESLRDKDSTNYS